MSARSRYLAAISPRESDNVVSPNGSNRGGKFDLSSPTAVAARQPRSFKPQSTQNAFVGAAPPPPPPGPPPAKKYGKRRDSSGSNKAADEIKDPVSFRGGKSSNSINSQDGTRTQSFTSQSSYKMERTPSNTSNSNPFPVTSPKFQQSSSFGRNQPQMNSSKAQSSNVANSQMQKPTSSSMQQPDSTPRSGGGEVWSPKDEIQSGNVARFKQMFLGGEDSSQDGASKVVISPQNRGSILDGADKIKDESSVNEESSITPSQRFGKQLAHQSNSNASSSQQSVQRAPPSTPPRPSASRLYNNSYNTQNRGRISTRSPSPPKYKLNAPPSLKLGGGADKTPPRGGLSINTGVTPPSRVFNERPEKSPAKGGYGDNSRSSSNTKNPSPLRQRASGLNLAPIDTSFGGNNYGRNSNSRENSSTRSIQSEGNETTSLPPSGSKYKGGDALSLLGASPSPANADGKHKFPFGEEEEEISPASENIIEGNSLSSANASIANESTQVEPPTPMNNPAGVTTVTSFKRPNSKVGIVFTRRSRASPDVCVISKIMPESIFSAHEQRYAREEEGGTLKGAEVIAVNGIPVREARHAAELVAGSAEEVRLTIRRGVPDVRSAENRVETIQEEEYEQREEEPVPDMPQSMPSSMEEANEGPNKTISFDEESEMSVKTDHEKKDSELEEQGPSGEQDWSNPKSNKSHDVVERRRQIARAMVMSSEMVDDPISSPGIQSFGEINTDGRVDGPKEPSPMGNGPPSTASAIERRRLAAMKMYQSQEMVADNVDDVRLGTIDAISPRETIDQIGAFATDRLQQSNNDPFGDNASVATTNVTTSSVATQRMGTNNINAFFGGNAFSPTNAVQRRRERAIDRTSKSNSFSRPETASTTAAPTSPTSPTASRSPVASSIPLPKNNSVSTILSVNSAPQSRSNKTDDDSVAVASMAGSAAASTAAISEASGESRGSRSLFGKKKKQSLTSTNQTAPTKKKSSIFGVANLIRKVNSRKGKSSKKGQLMEDSSLFNEQEMNDPPPSTKSVVIQNSPSTQTPQTINPPKSPEETQHQPGPEASPKEPIPQSSTWGSNEFFEDAFASSPFNDPNSSGHDAFGFPDTIAQDDSGFFDDSPDAWGEPSSLKSSLKPVDFTPRRNNFSSNAFENDAMSYDASEMSEVTNPTFVTQHKPDADGEDNGRSSTLKKPAGHVRHPSQGSSSQEQSESAVPLLGVNSSDSLDVAQGKATDGSESQKENSLPAVNKGNKLPPSYDGNPAISDDPPLVSIENSSDEEDNTLDVSKDSKQSASSYAKSRIMEKYAKAGRLRKPVRNDNRSNPPPPPSQTLYDQKASAVPRSRSVRPEIATGMHSKQQASFTPPRQRQDGNDPSSVDDTLARRNERIQRTNRLNQETREAAATAEPNPARQTPASPAPTSLVYKRRIGRNSPAIGLDKSIDNSFSSESRSRKKDVYSVKKKAAPSVVDDPNYYNMEEKLMQIKDPIQRAGVRLLWAAAIPIQTQARRFLARQAAIRRMCGILTIQAFVRRWLAERDLEIAIWSVIQIQAVFRGWYARDSLEDNHYCATQIQRVVRGYLATMHVFEDLYSITIVQSVIRRFLAINKAVDRLSSVIAIQAWYRGCSARFDMGEKEYSAIAIQSNWRRYLCQMSYQFDIIDIIIVQSIVRRRKATREREFLEIEQEDLCAVKIQSAWRSYDCSMTFVHTLADIITVQSVVRRWYTVRYLAAVRMQCLARVFLSKKRFSEQKAMNYLVTRHVSATKIQSAWRSYCAQVQMLIDIVNIIVIQSLWRRRTVLRLYKPLLNRIKLARERTMTKAAIKIQSAWRAFIVFSSCLILRYENQAATTIQSYWRRYYQCTNYSIIYYEIIKIQAAVRGHQQRSWRAFQEDCATIIQAYARRFLERKDCHNESMINILIAAASNSLRMRNAARKLQRWWLDEMWLRREKEAALIIERFFINVKAEVEAEVEALKKKKKEKRKLRKMKQSDEWILERAWLNTVEEPSFAQDETAPPKQQQKQQQDYRPPVPNSVGRMYAQSDRFIQGDVDMQSDVSGLTNSPGTAYQFSRKFRRTQIEIAEDASLEDAYHDSEQRYVQNEEEAYLRRQGYSSRQTASRSQNHSYRGRKAAM